MDCETAVGAISDYSVSGTCFYSQESSTNARHDTDSISPQISIEDRFRALESIYSVFPDYVPEPMNLVTDEAGTPSGYIREKVEGPSLKRVVKCCDLAHNERLARKLADDLEHMLDQLHSNGLDHGNLGLDQIFLPQNYKLGANKRYKQHILNSERAWPTLTEPFNLIKRLGSKKGLKQDLESLAYIKEVLEVD